jgi:SAM-dependent methyltransferase
MTPCKICGGELALRHPGSGQALDPALLSPTNHRPGEHADLYRCARCGTLQQPSLPGAPELARLYRGMRDDAYLDEERGRRHTAARVLDLLGPYSARGRLLDVGCGPGLLLDEARRRGYGAEGLELSDSSAAYAREDLGLTVHQTPLEEFEPDGRRFDAVVLADVLEHLSDPVGALRRCRKLLRPGGVLCVITPDPSSVAARVAGARWWGLLPAHTFLIPRATLRRIVEAEGFAIARDVSLVRTFSARYWLTGFAERGGRVGSLVRALGRLVPPRRMLSVPLGDERVIVAQAMGAAVTPPGSKRARVRALPQSRPLGAEPVEPGEPARPS